ncbi:MAG: HNH endonuclease [Acidobacteria bacterium]|nr:HNH endonuclease [Acidobacteriota bacterium]
MALEIAITGSERKRTAIPSYVRLAVYNRDNGECTYCHSRENLHFDHILPVAKGGSNDEKNIQLLCETCNWTKSDRIDG